MLAGNATSVILDRDSGYLVRSRATTPVTGHRRPGQLQVVFAGIQGQGVYMSTNQGQNWTLMRSGNIGNPLIVNTTTGLNVNPGLAQPNPNGAKGGSSWPSPPRPATPYRTRQYEGWLYAAVATATGGFDGLYLTKDFGENWTEVNTPLCLRSAPTTRPSPRHRRRQPQLRDHRRYRRQPGPRPDRRPDGPQYHLPGRLRGQYL